jgi:hypothetical protein
MMVIQDGAIVQNGTPAAVAARPGRNTWLAWSASTYCEELPMALGSASTMAAGSTAPNPRPDPCWSSSLQPESAYPGSGPTASMRTSGQDNSARSTLWASAYGSESTGSPRSPPKCHQARSMNPSSTTGGSCGPQSVLHHHPP